MESSNKVHCPQCQSESVSANQKGFSGKKAVAGALLTGGVGLLAGTIGSKKIIITCLNCAHTWTPGKLAKPAFVPTPASRRLNKIVLITFAVIMALIILICCL